MAESFKAKILDQQMNEVFDWSNSDSSIREALWDYFIEKNGHDPAKAEEAMLVYLTVSDDEIKSFVNDKLKK